MNDRAWYVRAALLLAAVLLASISLAPRAGADPAVYEVGDDPSLGFNLISWSNFGVNGPAAWQVQCKD